MKKRIALLVFLALLGLLAWRVIATVRTAVEEPVSQQRRERPAVSVEVAEARRAPIREAQQLTGTIHPSYRYVVAPRVAGRVLEITKRIGDRVSSGEVIARIDDAEYAQAVVEAEAALRSARASIAETKVQLDLAGQELERVSVLEGKGIASRAELEKAQADRDALESRLKLAMAVVEQREAALDTARIKLGYAVLAAPRDGYVGERFVDEGSLLSSNSPVLSVIGIDPVVVRTTVVERLYGRISIGQQTEIEVDAYQEKRFTGKVVRIAPMLKEDSRVAEMEVEVANASLQLKPGMFARVRIVLSQKPDAQVVPTSALVNRNGDTGVFVVDADGATARYVPVRTGIATPELTEILSPVLEGMVVTLGQHLLEDGSQVILPREGGPEGA